MPNATSTSRFAHLALVALVTLGTGARPLHAQRLPVGDAWEEYLRILQVGGLAGGASFTVRPFALRPALGSIGPDAEHPWSVRVTPPLTRALGRSASASLADPGVRVFANSAFPDGQNDGAVWQGKGLSAAMDAGATVTVGPLTLTAHPVLLYAQNGDFELADVRVAGMPPYAYPWRRMDLPQRYGPDALTRVDPGNSSIRLDLGGASLGFGTETLWWGPGVRNAILVSDNAAGFPHAFLGTGRPVDTGIGTLEAQWIFGRLQTSDWFDTTWVDPGRYVTGAVVALSPRGLDGLTLGVARMFYALVPEEGIGAGEYLLVFQGTDKQDLTTPDNPLGDDARDQLFSVFARWVLPESGFETWVEWARNDHGWDKRDYLLEPEHAQAYTLGFRKVTPLSGERLFALTGELTHLERSVTLRVRAVPTYYAHHLVLPGYTQRGQVVGAGIGPGGDAQFLGADVFAPWGKAGVFVQRRVHDNDAYYTLEAPTKTWCCHHVSLDLGAGGLFWTGDVEVSVRGALTKDFNRYFIEKNDVWNMNLQMSARWRPR